jgi:hypothetical protein
LIIERIPSPESITGTQEQQSIVEFDMSDHNVRHTAYCSETIGTLDDCVIG